MAGKQLKGPTLNLARKTFKAPADGGDPLWNERREFSRWEAWVYLFQRAAYSPHSFSTRTGPIEIQRGETPPLAERYLSEAWGWSRKRARTLLDFLENDGRIRPAQRTAEGTTYLIVNYDAWQYGGPAEDTADYTAEGPTEGTTDGTTEGPKREVRKKKKEKNEVDLRPTDVLFEVVWSEYPRKVGKTAAKKAWDKVVIRNDAKAVADGISRYAVYVKANETEPQFIKHLATLLNSGGWQDDWPVELRVEDGGQQDEWDIWIAKTQAELC